MTSATSPGSSSRQGGPGAGGRLSIVIVNWNVRSLLRDCLASLEADCAADAGEVIVVDNDSRDGSAAMVRSEFPWVTLIESGGNIGYSRGNNLGLSRASGDWLLLLNPDTLVPAGSLRRLLGFADAHPDAGAFAPLQYDGAGRIQYEAAVRFPTVWNVLCDFTLLSAAFPRSRWFNGRKLGDWAHDEDREVPAVSGAAMLIRRSVWERLGGLDEAMFCVEDMDYCRRIRNAGWRVWYVAAAPIVHYGRSSIVQQRQAWQRQAMLQSFWVYRCKHFGRTSGRTLSAAIFAWSVAAWAGLAVPALVLRGREGLGVRLRHVREMATALLSWSLSDKSRFRHPFAAAPAGGGR
ncbi:MAG: glycosyltransferase family 2 protein [Vicinamibacterales bacterium]